MSLIKGLIHFGSTVSMVDISSPATGFFVAYDSDGVLKQKDALGVITPIDTTGASFSITTNGPLYGGGSFGDPVGLSYSSDFITSTSSELALNLDQSQLVAPIITSSWSIYKKDGTTPFPLTNFSGSLLSSTSNLPNIKAPIGAVLSYSGSAKVVTSLPYTPNNISGDYIFTLPMLYPNYTGVTSSTNITTNKTYMCSTSRPKTGLILSGTTVQNAQVVRATGNLVAMASNSVAFDNIFYYGYLSVGPNGLNIDQAGVDSITAANIQSLSNYRWGKKAQSGFVINDTIYGNGFRFVFAYLATDGDVSSILTSLAPGINVVGAYLKRSTDVSITTLSGEVLTYRVWVAKPNNSYNNVTINIQ